MDALGAGRVDTLFTLNIFGATDAGALVAQVPLHFAFRVRAATSIFGAAECCAAARVYLRSFRRTVAAYANYQWSVSTRGDLRSSEHVASVNSHCTRARAEVAREHPVPDCLCWAIKANGAASRGGVLIGWYPSDLEYSHTVWSVTYACTKATIENSGFRQISCFKRAVLSFSLSFCLGNCKWHTIVLFRINARNESNVVREISRVTRLV